MCAVLPWQTEEALKEMVTAEGDKRLLFGPVPSHQHLLYRCREVVVGDASRHATEELKRRFMAGEETLLSGGWKGADEGLEGVGQPQEEELSRVLYPRDSDLALSPITLPLRTRRIGQGQVTDGVTAMRLLPVVHVLPHGSLLALIAIFIDQPVKDAFGGVSLFGRCILIRFQPGVDQGPDAVHHRPRSWAPLSVVPGRRSRPGNRLPHHTTVVVLLAGNGPNALLLAVVGPSDLFNLVHC